MQNLSIEHIISIVATLLVVALVGIYSGRKVKNSSDFATAGKKAGWQIVGGTIIGTLVGAASTVATSQMAFVYGFSAWWYTLGSSLACFLLAVIFTKRLWYSNTKTVPEILSKEYGKAANVSLSFMLCLSLFLSVIPQVLALSALLSSMLQIGLILATVLAIVLMIVYVVFGGVWGTGLAGVCKTILIYFSIVIAGFVVMSQAGGFSGFTDNLPDFPYFSMWGRGVSVGIGGFVSAISGVLSSQTYIQAVMSGKSVNASRIGAISCAVLIPPIGFVSVLIGLFMKIHFPDINAASAFPLFILQYMNPWVAGVILATILIAVIGTGAGITLGISTILTNDIYKKIFRPDATDKQILFVSRLFIVLSLAVTFVFTYGNLKSLMLQWTFLSMGLRGTAGFLPLVFALFLQGKVRAKAAVLGMTLGPIGVIFWKFFGNKAIDPVYLGIGIVAVFMIAGYMMGTENKPLISDKGTKS
jgi:SSS family solute:Na+ symporter